MKCEACGATMYCGYMCDESVLGILCADCFNFDACEINHDEGCLTTVCSDGN